MRLNKKKQHPKCDYHLYCLQKDAISFRLIDFFSVAERCEFHAKQTFNKLV